MLTDREIKGLEPKSDKRYMVADGGMLFVKVYPSGLKSFVFDYKDPKTRILKRHTLGKYPEMSLKEARDERDRLKYLLRTTNSINEKIISDLNFEQICEKYFAQKNDVLPKTLASCRARVYNHCKKILAFKIDKVEKSDILDIFEKLKLAKKSGVAKRLFNDLSNIFIYAINRDFVQNSPMTGIIKKELIYKSPIKHYATIIEKDKIQQLLGDILDCKSEIFVKIATLMSLFTAQRSFNVRSALWENLDLEKGIWQIPAVDMKMKRQHIVHLNKPCLKMLKFYKQFADEKRVFASIYSKREIISNGTIRMMFRRMGYDKETFTPHGFRSMFSTICHEYRKEHGLSSDIIELCLAHIDKNAVRASYNFASNLDERKRLFEWWGEFLCELEPRLRNLEAELG